MNINRILLKLAKKIYFTCFQSSSIIIQNYIRTIHNTNMYNSQVNVVAITHQKTFGSYKNINKSKDIAIIATGPSLNNYKVIDNVIYIGVNKALFFDKIKFQYIFTQDYSANKTYIERYNDYPGLIKFYGRLPNNFFGSKELSIQHTLIPESTILKHNANKYYLYSKWPTNPLYFNTDIDKTWLADGGSVIFSAMQFALFTNPRRIYLVGCDCSNGYFDQTSDKKTKINKTLYKSWQELKKFADIYYPETEIISVNPVGLKGLFKDMYQ